MFLIDSNFLFRAFMNFWVVFVFIFLDHLFMMLFYFGYFLLELSNGDFKMDDFVIEGVDFIDVANGFEPMVLDFFFVFFEFAGEG